MHHQILIDSERHPEREFFTPRTTCNGPAAPLIMLAAALGTAYVQYQGGKAERYALKSQAEEEKLAAKDREIARRAKLLKALAGRNVASAAGGTALEGTDIALVNKDFSEYSAESVSNLAMSSARVRSLNAAGSTAKKLGTISAGATLFAAAANAPTYLGKKPGAG